ncbi:MAG: argininosuccinate synthase, partial [Thermoproteota archaeon]|nr:argininosuccinate synthase [Thermoproteota archaeon]
MYDQIFFFLNFSKRIKLFVVVRSPAMNKVVLAFSGGLDTSVCVKYLQKIHNLDVITLTVDVGQEDDFSEIEKISSNLESVGHVYINAKEEFVN